MKKLPLLFLLIASVYHLPGFSQDKTTIIKEYLNADFEPCSKDSAKFFRESFYDVDHILHGRMKTYYLSGKLYGDFGYYHGICDGDWTFYFENGNKKSEIFYDNGTFYLKNSWSPNGIPEVVNGTGHYNYYDNFNTSNIIDSGNYINFVQNGEWIWHYDDGKIFEKALFEFDEVESVEIWDRNENIMVKEGTGAFIYTKYGVGKISSKGFYKNSKRDSSWIWFYRDGKKQEVAHYSNGILQGGDSVWYPNGKLKFAGTYVDGKLDGDATWWYWNGQKKEEGTYINGTYKIKNKWNRDGKHAVVDGTGYFENHYNNGVLESTGYYKNGYREKLWTWYYRNGNKMEVSEYHNNNCSFKTNFWQEDGKQTLTNANGTFIDYYKSGNREVEGGYKNKQRDGQWIWYYTHGQPSTKSIYSNGKLISRIAFTKSGIKNYELEFDTISQTEKEFYYFNDSGKLYKEALTKQDQWYLINYWDSTGTQLIKNGNGEYKEFQNKVLIANGKYENGLKIGKWMYYNSDGVLICLENYKNGKEDGKKIYYHTNGSIKSSYAFTQGQRDGKIVCYDEVGNKEYTGCYKNDKRDGRWVFYRNQKIYTDEYYKEGKLVSAIGGYLKNGEPLYFVMDQYPKPYVGYRKLFHTVEENLPSSNTQFNDTTDGIVQIGFIVTKGGYIMNPQVYKSVDPYHNSVAMRLFKDYCMSWSPGMQNGKPVNAIHFMPISFNAATKLKYSFSPAIIQDEQEYAYEGQMIQLEKKPFAINVKFPQPNFNTVSVLATSDSIIFEKARRGYPMIQLVEYAAAMAEDYGNPSNELLMDDEAYSLFYYDDSTDNRFNLFSITEKEISCTRNIDSITIVKKEWNKNSETPGKTIPVAEYPYKNLYLIFFNRETFNSQYYYDYKRVCYHIKFR